MDFVVARLDLMLSPEHATRYAMWGGAESYEAQVLLLLEILYATSLGFDCWEFNERYVGFLRSRHATLGPRPLCTVEADHAVIATELRGFRAELEKETTP